jgi:DNA-binding NarL/FixJ family response regulator
VTPRSRARRAWPGEERPVKRWKRSPETERRLVEKRRSSPDLCAFANAIREVFGLDDLYRRPDRVDTPETLSVMRALKAAGATQKEIARELDVSQSHVSRALRGAP